MIIGIVIGVLIGLITGTVFLLLLKTADRASEKGAPILALTSELLAIPTFWFGGPWLTSGLLKLVPLSELISPYLIALTAVFAMISLYPAARWIIQLGDQLGAKRQ